MIIHHLIQIPPNRFFFNSIMFFSHVSSISSFMSFPSILESEVLEGVILLLLSRCSVLELLHCTSHFCLASRSKYELYSQGEGFLLPQMFFICFPAEVSPVTCQGHFLCYFSVWKLLYHASNVNLNSSLRENRLLENSWKSFVLVQNKAKTKKPAEHLLVLISFFYTM